ncbi:BH3 interacting domain death agonist [Cetorhinus maximus]
MSWNGNASFDEQTQHILLKFLQEEQVENRAYQQEIQKLENELRRGSRFDDDIQTDGHCPSGPLRAAYNLNVEEVNPADEELYRVIAAHLAEMGDRLDQSINRDLVEEFIRETERTQPQEDGTFILTSMINCLLGQTDNVTQDMPQEKVILLLALMLFKKTVVEKPLLLPHIFRTTVQYISSKLQHYIQNIGGWQNIH